VSTTWWLGGLVPFLLVLSQHKGKQSLTGDALPATITIRSHNQPPVMTTPSE